MDMNMEKKNTPRTPTHPASSSPSPAAGATRANGMTVDWRRLEAFQKRAELAGLRMGNPPCEWEPLTEEELAEIAESTRRLNASTLPKADRKSEEIIREMRDAAVGIFPKQ